MTRCALLLLVGLALAQPAVAVRYRFVELQSLHPTNNSVWSLNDTGWVVGESNGPFVWTLHTGSRLLGPRPTFSWSGNARGVNDSGMIVGDALLWSAGGLRFGQPLVWTPTLGPRRVPTPVGPGTMYAVNESGLAVGEHRGVSPKIAIAYRLGGAVTYMGRLDPRGSSVAYDVNDSATAAGTATVLDAQNRFYARPFRWTEKGGIRPVRFPEAGFWVTCFGINNHGTVLMNVQFPTGLVLVYTQTGDEEPVMVGPGEGVKINDAGQIVGSFVVGGQTAAMLYEPGVGMLDLNAVTEGLPSNWRLYSARDINRAGDIAVGGFDFGSNRDKMALLVRLD